MYLYGMERDSLFLPLPGIIRVIKTMEHEVGGNLRGTADLIGQRNLPSQQRM